MAIDKIVPLNYVVDTDPVPVDIINASGWFTTESMEYRDDGKQDLLGWYLAQGWTVTGTEYFTWYYHYNIYGTLINTKKYKIYTLTRRKLQAERALNDLISDFTTAYNDGRIINDTRYDEILDIYNVGLDETEDEINATTTSIEANDVVIEAIVELLLPDFTSYEADVDILDDYGTDERARINLQYNNELAKATNALIARGMNNTTVSTSVSAGIEEARTRSLNNFEDILTERILVNKTRIYEAKTNVRASVMSARDRLVTLKRDNAVAGTESRNRVLLTMLDFMERRTDDYPSLESLGDIAAKIGFTDTGAVVKP